MLFDWFMGLLIMCFAFTQGVFPKPPDFSKLPAFDISFFASHMRFTLFFLTVLGVAFVAGFALLSAKVRAFWQRIRQGLSILSDRRRYQREMCRWQFASWIARFAAYWALLDAFHIGGSVRNALLVLAVQVVASVFPFTPGGAGVQQALLLQIFAHNPYVAAFSVGQQIATAALSSGLGFGALVFIFRFRSFKEVMARAREHRRAEGGAAPRSPRSRGRPTRARAAQPDRLSRPGGVSAAAVGAVSRAGRDCGSAAAVGGGHSERAALAARGRQRARGPAVGEAQLQRHA